MAISSSRGTLYLAAADWNSLFKVVLVWARTRPLALPSKTAPASPPPLNLRKSRRSTPESIPDVGFPPGAVQEHSEHIFPLLPWRGTRMLPTAKGSHKSKAPTGEERPELLVLDSPHAALGRCCGAGALARSTRPC